MHFIMTKVNHKLSDIPIYPVQISSKRPGKGSAQSGQPPLEAKYGNRNQHLNWV